MLRLLLPAPRLAWHAQPDDADGDPSTATSCSFALPLSVALDCGEEAAPVGPWGSPFSPADAVAWLQDGGVRASCNGNTASVRLRLVSAGAILDAHDRLVGNGARPRAARKPRPGQAGEHDTQRMCVAQGYRMRIVAQDNPGGPATAAAAASNTTAEASAGVDGAHDGDAKASEADGSGGGGDGGGGTRSVVEIEAATVAGFHNGVQTLLQWLLLHNPAHTDSLLAYPGTTDAARNAAARDGSSEADERKAPERARQGAGASAAPWALECGVVEVVDWPDFEHRGVMLDVSRDRVWTMATLRSLVRRLAAWKVNQVQLYFEHAFQYRGHQDVWEGSGAYSGACLGAGRC